MVAKPILILRQRPSGRRSERGAAIFIVVLVITLLTGIGLFAARVTGSVDAAAGYARQSSQARSLALVSTQMAAAILANERDAIRLEMEQAEANPNPGMCLTNRNRRSLQCALRRHRDVDRVSATSLRQAQVPVLTSQAEKTHGSLGSRTDLKTPAGVEGNLLVEYFERVAAARVAGVNQSSNAPGQASAYEYSVTASAQIRPVINGASDQWCSPDNETSSANVQSIRLYVTSPEM